MGSGRVEPRMRLRARVASIIVVAVFIGGFALVAGLGSSSSTVVVHDLRDLIAGQSTDAGDVELWNDADNLYVKFETAPPWMMTATQLDVASSVSLIPQVNGNPIPGQFDLRDTHDPAVTEWTYILPMDTKAGKSLCVVAHAMVVEETTMSTSSAAGDIVYGPLYVETAVGDPSWGEAKSAVEAKNWISVYDNPIVPGLYIGTPAYRWGVGMQADVPGGVWISTAQNTEAWWVPSWRWYTKEFAVPDGVLSASIGINVDDMYSLYVNGQFIGSDNHVFGPYLDPIGTTGVETYTLQLLAGVNRIDVLALNTAYTPDGQALSGQIHNPNGLAYKVDVVIGTEDSAWSAGSPFSGPTWATYSTYTWQKA